ncbi:MAG: hypothetical protein GY940_46030 [bacterium]|nr:hypothetical protein [bacterium]
MFVKQLLILIILAALTGNLFISAHPAKDEGGILFTDDFENGDSKWYFTNANKINVRDSGDSGHGKVLVLQSGGPAVYALLKGSDQWKNIRIEGEMLFPGHRHHYLGLMYNYNVKETRSDFGCVYIYGPRGVAIDKLGTYRRYRGLPAVDYSGNVVMVNPHRDGNASRFLYSEYWTLLPQEDAIKPGTWHRFKAEIMGTVCHFYVDDMETPRVTSEFLEFSSGSVGLKPRYTGGESWVDNVKVTSIETFSYTGPPLPEGRNYKPGELVTQWHVAGPLAQRIDDIDSNGFQPDKTYNHQGKTVKWEPFNADPRGCVVSGRVVDKYSGKRFAYFHSEISSESDKEVAISFNTSNPLELWVNGTRAGNVRPSFTVWYDFWENPDHKGPSLKATLKAGKNDIMILVKGGRYGGDGFFVRIGDPVEKK